MPPMWPHEFAKQSVTSSSDLCTRWRPHGGEGGWCWWRIVWPHPKCFGTSIILEGVTSVKIILRYPSIQARPPQVLRTLPLCKYFPIWLHLCVTNAKRSSSNYIHRHNFVQNCASNMHIYVSSPVHYGGPLLCLIPLDLSMCFWQVLEEYSSLLLPVAEV